MMIFTLMALGAAGVVVVWRLVAAERVSVWAGQGILFGGAGLAALATGRVNLSPRVGWIWALLAGLGSGVALYLATAEFVRVVRRWPPFERHVAGIYGQRKGRSLPAALLLAAAIVAPGEELFWRGLFQGRLAGVTGWVGAAALTWAIYAAVNATSGSFPIIAAAVVSGAAWGGLALWTHGALASLMSHAVWTALMIAAPPAGGVRRPRRSRERSEP